jgi:hypothetical protein
MSRPSTGTVSWRMASSASKAFRSTKRRQDGKVT